MAKYKPATIAAYTADQVAALYAADGGMTTGFGLTASPAPASGSAMYTLAKAEGFFTGYFPLKYYTPAQATTLGDSGILAAMKAEGISTGNLATGWITHAAGDSEATILAALRADGYISGSGLSVVNQVDPAPAQAIVSARVYNNATQACADSSTTTLSFNSESFDTLAIHDPGAPTKLTAPVAGYYQIGANIEWLNAGVNANVILGIRSNSANVLGRATGSGATGSRRVGISTSVLAYLNAGDFVEAIVVVSDIDAGATLVVVQASDGATNQYSCEFMMTLVR